MPGLIVNCLLNDFARLRRAKIINNIIIILVFVAPPTRRPSSTTPNRVRCATRNRTTTRFILRIIGSISTPFIGKFYIHNHFLNSSGNNTLFLIQLIFVKWTKLQFYFLFNEIE